MHYIRYILMLMGVFLLAACGTSTESELNESAPEFTLMDANGENVSLSDYSGKPVLLYFHMAVG